MITDKDLEILYYVPADAYRGIRLDGDSDPNYITNIGKKSNLKNKMLACSNAEFIETFIKAYKNNYANDWIFSPMLATYDSKTKVKTPIRKDITNLIFDYKYEGVSPITQEDEMYFLNNVFIEFIQPISGIENIIANALTGKIFNKDIAKKTFTINNSPILKIVYTNNSIHMFLDKEKFIDYEY